MKLKRLCPNCAQASRSVQAGRQAKAAHLAAQRANQRILIHRVCWQLALHLALLPRLPRRRLLLLLLPRGCPFCTAACAPATHVPGQGIDVAVVVGPHHVLRRRVLVVLAGRCSAALLSRGGPLRCAGSCGRSSLSQRCAWRCTAGRLQVAGSCGGALRRAAGGKGTCGGPIPRQRRLVGVQPGGLLHWVVVALRQGNGWRMVCAGGTQGGKGAWQSLRIQQ